MSNLLFAPAREDQARRTICSRYAAVIASVALLLCLAGCSGLSSAGRGSTTSNGGTGSTGGSGGTTSGGGGGTSGGTTSDLTIGSVLPAATVGVSYNGSVTASGGKAPYAFSIASGQLPPGIVLAGATGAVTGTPSQTGSFNFSVSVADSSGLSKQQSLGIQVASASSGGGTGASSFSNLQNSVGWASYGQGPPDFVDCSPSPCDGITFSMQQGISSPSMSGAAAQFNLGGTAVYTDALFNNHLIGDLSSQNMPDHNHTLVPTYHNFTYDVYFYGTNLAVSQAVEFDVNQFFNDQGFIWGHECRIAGGNEWDIWDNINAHWVPTGIPCYPNSNQWNHVTIQVERTSDNQLLYQSITLNGTTSNVNKYYSPGAAVGWYGVTVNYQMDGNYEQAPYTVYLDNLTFSYQ